ncbi:MAG: ASPIC/UnbV domain-containing protein, partial [Planctomycetes bacterium]|nr:ASPIC/UnbV domain-containing protein [Planctomycetota bacterium]
ANRDGIGCRVTVSAGGRRQIRELHGAAGHAGHQNPAELSFALGTAEKIDLIEIRWTSKARGVTQHRDLPAGHAITIQEGDPPGVDLVPLQPRK